MAGRGRGFDIINRDESSRRKMLRRPYNVEEGPLSKMLTELKLSEINIDEMSGVTAEVKKLSKSEESLKKAVSLIYKYSHQSKKHALLGALLFQELSDLQAENVKVRHLLLRTLQNDFVESDSTIVDPNKFLDQVTFLCELFRSLRINGSPIAVLGKATMIYFERLLEGSEEEFKVLLEQLPKNAKDLENCDEEKFTDFLLKIRKKLITDSTLNISSRTLLLASFECCLKGREPLEPKVENMYENLSGFCFNE